MHVDIGFHHLAELVFVRFLHYKVTFPPFPLEGSHYVQPTRRVEMSVPLLKGGYLLKLYGILLHDLALLPPIY